MVCIYRPTFETWYVYIDLPLRHGMYIGLICSVPSLTGTINITALHESAEKLSVEVREPAPKIKSSQDSDLPVSSKS